MRLNRHLGLFLLLLAPTVHAANDAPSITGRPDAFFTSEDGKKVADNLLTWQGIGPDHVMCWPKAYDATMPYPGNLVKNAKGDKLEWDGIATIDNGATHSELKILARAISAEPEGPRRTRWIGAFNKGFDAALSQQYPNGGWPQRFPPTAPNQAKYAPHITFNDNAMTNLLAVLEDISNGEAPYTFVDADRRKAAKVAFDKGLDCILNCQVKIDGTLTVWCAQHDEKNLAPAQGRAYEPPSLSGGESANLAIFLMSIDHPSDRVKTAINAAFVWFDKVKIENKSFRGVTDTEGLRDRQLIDSPGSVVWARFYDLKTQKPIFEGRDSVIHDSLPEIERERRTGYGWYGPWGHNLTVAYNKWKKKNP